MSFKITWIIIIHTENGAHSENHYLRAPVPWNTYQTEIPMDLKFRTRKDSRIQTCQLEERSFSFKTTHLIPVYPFQPFTSNAERIHYENFIWGKAKKSLDDHEWLDYRRDMLSDFQAKATCLNCIFGNEKVVPRARLRKQTHGCLKRYFFW